MNIDQARRDFEAEFRKLFNKQPYTFTDRLIDLIKAERDELRKKDPDTYRNRVTEVGLTKTKSRDKTTR